MTFQATVVRVLIASPGDVAEARDVVERALLDWNRSRAERAGVVLLPWRWETSAVPMVGGHPQALLNLQGADSADIVIAVFGTRLGSPTPSSLSGSVEEIDRARDRGVPVHVYFSTAPMSNDVDLSQVQALRDFRQDLRERALYREFSSVSELSHLVWQAVEKDVPAFGQGSGKALAADGGIQFIPQVRQASEPVSDGKGGVKIRKKHWVEVLNDSETDAIEVLFSVVGEPGAERLLLPGSPRTLHARQHVDLPLIRSMGKRGDWRLRIQWKEDGELMSKDFDVA